MEKKIVKKGDIYQLGDHKLMCGSSTDAKDVEKLLDGVNDIRMVLTDPPYGVAYVENKEHFKNASGESQIAKPKIIENDQLQTPEEYKDFSIAWISNVTKHLDSYNTFYIFNADLMMCALRSAMEQAGLYYSQMIIWIKNTIVIGRKDYLPQHELILYGWFGRHKFERGKAKSVIFHPKPSKAKLHPTMKPVGLLRKLILNSTKINEKVYDAFGGSGSTLIACEHTKRSCYMMELDEEYCSVIIERWETLTEDKAKLL